MTMNEISLTTDIHLLYLDSNKCLNLYENFNQQLMLVTNIKHNYLVISFLDICRIPNYVQNT